MYSTRICDAILSSPVPSPEFFTVHGSRLRFSVLPRATSLKMKLQCRSVGSLNEASERSPGFFLNLTMGFTGSTMGIQWDIMGYTSIIYVCDTVDGCQILHQLKDVVKKHEFQHVSTIQRWCRISQESTVHFSKQWLSGFSTQQWLLRVILIAFDKCFFGTRITPLLLSV